MLGASVKVPSHEGEREIELPSGTQHGTQYALRGHGLPGSNGGPPGDMVIVVHVLVPSDLSEEQAASWPASSASRSSRATCAPPAARRRASSPASAAPSVDQARGPLLPRAGRPGPRRAHGPRPERGRGRARPRLRRVRDLRRRGGAAGAGRARGGGRRRAGRGDLDRGPRRLGRPLAGLPQAAAGRRPALAAALLGGAPRGDDRPRRRPRPRLRHRRPPDHPPLPRATCSSSRRRARPTAR